MKILILIDYAPYGTEKTHLSKNDNCDGNSDGSHDGSDVSFSYRTLIQK